MPAMQLNVRHLLGAARPANHRDKKDDGSRNPDHSRVWASAAYPKCVQLVTPCSAAGAPRWSCSLTEAPLRTAPDCQPAAVMPIFALHTPHMEDAHTLSFARRVLKAAAL